ncbi:hypothetical protein RA265_27980, partial [Pseudomonas syringae pv. tagetis]|uniref:hypothetical protein n=1 Tax=Pseudomonas syringae group genomosp. 7 TaxID=251699 RepID=UPI00376F6645
GLGWGKPRVWGEIGGGGNWEKKTPQFGGVFGVFLFCFWWCLFCFGFCLCLFGFGVLIWFCVRSFVCWCWGFVWGLWGLGLVVVVGVVGGWVGGGLLGVWWGFVLVALWVLGGVCGGGCGWGVRFLSV